MFEEDSVGEKRHLALLEVDCRKDFAVARPRLIGNPCDGPTCMQGILPSAGFADSSSWSEKESEDPDQPRCTGVPIRKSPDRRARRSPRGSKRKALSRPVNGPAKCRRSAGATAVRPGNRQFSMEGSPASDWVGEEPTPEHFLACPAPRGASQGDYGRELVQLFPVGNGPLLAGSISSSGEQALLGPAPTQPLPAGGGKGSAFLLAEEGVPWPGSAQPLPAGGEPLLRQAPTSATRESCLSPTPTVSLATPGGPVSVGDWLWLRRSQRREGNPCPSGRRVRSLKKTAASQYSCQVCQQRRSCSRHP